jgi:hypothetical protein
LASFAPWRETSLPAILRRAEELVIPRPHAATVETRFKRGMASRQGAKAQRKNVSVPQPSQPAASGGVIFWEFFPDFREFGALASEYTEIHITTTLRTSPPCAPQAPNGGMLLRALRNRD